MTAGWRERLGVILPSDRGTVVTVGSFDGVHRGHGSVLAEVRRRAQAADLRSVLVTFDPHPLRILRPEDAPPLLTTPIEKKEILAESGLDYAVFLRFTRALSRYAPERFVEEILHGGLGAEELVIGYDHGFGRDRSGDVETLRRAGDRLGFAVDVVGPIEADGEAISSTRIREALSRGDVEAAARGLGRPYSVRGVVVRGDGRGRRMGFPTANLTGLGADKLLPAPGVYAVRAWTRAQAALPGALHLGPRPTFPGASASVEVHLLDTELDLYGERLRVDFISRVRGVESFDSVEALVAQMGRDVADVREILAGAIPL
ncbi:MAG: bifunctional riboflavin kinase/FAD synthetase [Longimicrobiales bacterium]|nr:bifunctional riboflavin kinase/FAD synthetase [Longimicrobiales bacterium]